MRLSEQEKAVLRKYLNREIPTDLNESMVKSIINNLIGALDSKQRVVEKLCSGQLISDSTLMNLQRTLGDYTIKDKLRTGVIFEDDIINMVLDIKYQKSLNSYSLDALKEINYPYKHKNNDLQEIVCDLANMVKMRDRQIAKQEEEIKLINSKCNQFNSLKLDGYGAEADKIIALRKKGYSKASIVRETGIGKNKVYRICKELGI